MDDPLDGANPLGGHGRGMNRVVLAVLILVGVFAVYVIFFKQKTTSNANTTSTNPLVEYVPTSSTNTTSTYNFDSNNPSSMTTNAAANPAAPVVPVAPSTPTPASTVTPIVPVSGGSFYDNSGSLVTNLAQPVAGGYINTSYLTSPSGQVSNYQSIVSSTPANQAALNALNAQVGLVGATPNNPGGSSSYFNWLASQQ